MADAHHRGWGISALNSPGSWDTIHENDEDYTSRHVSDQDQIALKASLPPLTNLHGAVYNNTKTFRPLLILPHPAQILKHKKIQLCKACGKASCELASHRYYTNAATTTHLPSDTVSRFRTLSTSNLTDAHSPPDLFNGYPLVMDNGRQRLLALWFQPWGCNRRGPERHLFPVCWIEAVLPAARKHAPLFHALLATSASFRALGNTETNDIAPQYMRSASHLLSDMPKDLNSRSDECILAHICLMLVLVAQGNMYEAAKRFETVTALVALRGGPHYLGLKGIIAESLFHADFLQAISLARLPTYQMLLPALEVGVPPQLGNAFRELAPSQYLNGDLLLAADSLCRCTDIFELSQTTIANASGAVNALGYLTTISEYQLAKCHTLFSGAQNWNEVICLALLMFNNAVLRSHGGLDAVLRKLEHRFWITVDGLLARTGFDNIPRYLILWALFTGLTTSIYQQSQYQTTAIEKLHAASIGVLMNGWEDFRAKVLDRFLWMRQAQEETFYHIWLEVERYGGSRPEMN